MADRVNRISGWLGFVAIFAIAGCGGGGKTAGGSTETGGAGGGDETGGASGTPTPTGGRTGTGGSAEVDARASEPEGTGGAAGGGAPDAAAMADSAAGGAAGKGGAGGAPACGMAGQMCCPGDTCAAGAMPMTSPGGGGGMTVLELHASGGDPYALFKMKDLLPIDGPDSGYITDEGTDFKFVLHQNGAEETVSSGAHRQRNEVTVNPGNPAIYKGLSGDTMSYTWRFHLDTINAHPTWCTIFQIKQHGPLGVAPLLQFRTQGDNVDIAFRLTTAKSIPLTAIMGQWITASLTIKYGHNGTAALLLKKEDGSVLLDYKNDNADMWDANTDFVRPKWGLYRNQAAGAGEASIRYNDMKIIRGTIGAGGGCTCK
jgi:hypothetical protein